MEPRVFLDREHVLVTDQLVHLFESTYAVSEITSVRSVPLEQEISRTALLVKGTCLGVAVVVAVLLVALSPLDPVTVLGTLALLIALGAGAVLPPAYERWFLVLVQSSKGTLQVVSTHDGHLAHQIRRALELAVAARS